MPLRDLEIRALKPEARVYKRTDERRLYLEVHPNGSKLWRFKFAHLGKDKRIALGRYPGKWGSQTPDGNATKPGRNCAMASTPTACRNWASD